MARMYSKARGASGSKKPVKPTNPSWQRYQTKEIEVLAAKLAKAGKTPSLIGLHLRDVYGLPNIKAVTGKKLSAILKEKNALHKLPEDMRALIRRLLKINAHLELNNHDEPAKRGQVLTQSKLNRLIKYYKKTKRLPSDWKLNKEKLRLYIE